MNAFNAYLAKLGNELGMLNAAERKNIIAEIESHVEDGLQDPRMGNSQAERESKLMEELGNPAELGNGMNHTHYRNSWLDIVLALVPGLIIFLTKIFIISITVDMRMAAFGVLPLYLAMITISFRRRSLMLQGWWLAWTVLYATQSLMISTDFGEGPFTLPFGVNLAALVFFGLSFIGSIGFFGKKLWDWRQNGLLVAFALQPVVWNLVTTGIGVMEARLASPTASGAHVNMMAMVEFPLYILLVILTFFPPSRRIRWYGLVVCAAAFALTTVVIWQSMPVVALITSASIILAPVACGILLDYRFTRRNPLALT